MKANEGKKRFVVLKFLLIVLGAAVLGSFGGFGAMWLRETVLLIWLVLNLTCCGAALRLQRRGRG